MNRVEPFIYGLSIVFQNLAFVRDMPSISVINFVCEIAQTSCGKRGYCSSYTRAAKAQIHPMSSTANRLAWEHNARRSLTSVPPTANVTTNATITVKQPPGGVRSTTDIIPVRVPPAADASKVLSRPASTRLRGQR
jgi:hypothetical protein